MAAPAIVRLVIWHHGRGIYSRVIVFKMKIYALFDVLKTQAETGEPNMSTERDETQRELDCQVTVYDGSWMTCDMIEDDRDD